jgi:hypothetical protein
MTVLLSALWDAVRQTADIEGDPHVEDPSITRWINRAIERAYKIAIIHAPGRFQLSSSFTLAGGVAGNTTAIPSGMRRLVHVAKDPTSPSLRRTIHRLAAGELEGSQELGYRVVGATVQIEPFNYCQGNYALYYIGGPTILVNATDALDAALEPATEFIETWAAIKAMGKSEDDTRDLRADLLDLAEELPVAFANIDSGDDEHITDMDNVGNNWPWDIP